MNTSKTIKTINKFYSLCGLDSNPNIDEKIFMNYFELELAKSLISEFDNNIIKRLAKILLIFTESD